MAAERARQDLPRLSGQALQDVRTDPNPEP